MTTIVMDHSAVALSAQAIWLDITGGIGSRGERNKANQALALFRMTTGEQTGIPWPKDLLDPLLHANDAGLVNHKLGLRNLIVLIRDACYVLLLAATGMRISEIVSIRGGWTLGAELPDAIVRRRSESGLLDLFFVLAAVSKERSAPIQDEWLIGSCASGSSELPAAVQAVIVLERLMAPWRDLSPDAICRDQLGAGFTCPGMPNERTSVVRLTTHRLARSSKRIFERFVRWDDLPDSSSSPAGADLKPYRRSHGACIRSHQFRKNFGKFLLRIDSRLLPALKRQFKHLRMATTERSYVGHDLAALANGDDERRLAANGSIASLLGLGGRTGGRLSAVISRHERTLPSIHPGGVAEEANADGVIDGPVRLLPGEHGSCGIRFAPSRSRCNGLVSEANFLNDVPNHELRSPAVCSGCELYHLDDSHVPFWRRRWLVNERTWRQASRKGLQDEYRIAQKRAEIAKKVLSQLGYFEGGTK